MILSRVRGSGGRGRGRSWIGTITAMEMIRARWYARMARPLGKEITDIKFFFFLKSNSNKNPSKGITYPTASLPLSENHHNPTPR